MHVEHQEMVKNLPPSREGRVQISFWITPELRSALKVTVAENSTSLQDALEEFCETYAAAALKRMKRRSGD